jgi:hypothetical protein
VIDGHEKKLPPLAGEGAFQRGEGFQPTRFAIVTFKRKKAVSHGCTQMNTDSSNR